MSETGPSADVVDEARGVSRHITTKSVVVGIALLLGASLVVEQVGAQPAVGRRPTTKWTAFEPRLAPKPSGAASDVAASGTAAAVPTGDAAIASARQRADDAIAAAQDRVAAVRGGGSSPGAGGSGVAPLTPGIGARVCPVLLHEAAELVAQVNRLIAANPSLASVLIAVRDRGLARLNAQSTRFGCGISAG